MALSALFRDLGDGIDCPHRFPFEGFQRGITFDHYFQVVEHGCDLGLFLLVFGEYSAQGLDEIPNNLVYVPEIAGDIGVFLVPQLSDELAYSLPVALGLRNNLFIGGLIFTAWIGGGYQDMPRPLFAALIDRGRVYSVQVEGVFAEYPQQCPGGVERIVKHRVL
jgi:hypothetical protein